jgi:hypothetical protein
MPGESLAAVYESGAREMRLLHEGPALLRVAEILVSRSPQRGRTVFMASSQEGVALAALCATLASNQETRWCRINLDRPPDVDASEAVVVVEPVHGGEGWKEAVRSRFPKAWFIIASETPDA